MYFVACVKAEWNSAELEAGLSCFSVGSTLMDPCYIVLNCLLIFHISNFNTLSFSWRLHGDFSYDFQILLRDRNCAAFCPWPVTRLVHPFFGVGSGGQVSCREALLVNRARVVPSTSFGMTGWQTYFLEFSCLNFEVSLRESWGLVLACGGLKHSKHILIQYIETQQRSWRCFQLDFARCKCSLVAKINPHHCSRAWAILYSVCYRSPFFKRSTLAATPV